MIRPARRALTRAAPPLLLAGLLAACAARPDTFSPDIVITTPGSDGASRVRSFVVKGYVLDDQGVKSLTVQGVDVPLPGREKIEPFSFKTLVQGGSANYRIQATDTSGNVSTLNLPVRVDVTPPKVSVSNLERDGNVIRVSGKASDDQKVAEVLVDGTRLNITPGKSVEFFAQSTGTSADIEVRDSAGNVVKLKAQ